MHTLPAEQSLSRSHPFEAEADAEAEAEEVEDTSPDEGSLGTQTNTLAPGPVNVQCWFVGQPELLQSLKAADEVLLAEVTVVEETDDEEALSTH